jgi:acyl-CoA synthetase (AMP-forming)/AMP-acid ligase II/acyl carrier protein
MSPESLRLWKESPARSVRLLNSYGPTEATITTTTFEISPGEDLPHRISIGRPLPGRRIYVLDQNLEPVPVGVPGELHIGGAGLARGYLNQPELTAEKFISDPFSNAPGARLYKTGDLVRYLPNGNIDFLGRIDDQVKIRGFRIELGELEAVLHEHPGVRECVTVVREDTPGDKRLVAYIVASQKEAPSTSELHEFLAKKLPDYMVPSAFVMLDTLPLTPSGKIDRRALPAPDKTRPELEEAFVAPRTEVEKELARIWIEVLGLERVGIHDNFFHLGGHSLKATQVINRVHSQMGLELPLREIFESPTIAEIAETIMTCPRRCCRIPK